MDRDRDPVSWSKPKVGRRVVPTDETRSGSNTTRSRRTETRFRVDGEGTPGIGPTRTLIHGLDPSLSGPRSEGTHDRRRKSST